MLVRGLSKSRPVNIASGTLFTSTRVVTTAAGTHDTTIDSLGTIDLAQSKCEEAPAPESPSPNLGAAFTFQLRAYLATSWEEVDWIS